MSAPDLESFKRGLSGPEFKIWTISSRAVRFSTGSSRTSSKVLLKRGCNDSKLGAPNHGSRVATRRIYRRVGIPSGSTSDGELLRASSSTTHENSSSHGKNKKRGNNSSSKVDLGSLVANSNVHRHSMDGRQRHDRTSREFRVTKEPRVEVVDSDKSGGKSLLRLQVEATRRRLMTSMPQPSTLKKYCAFVDEPSLPANVDVLESYMYSMLDNGRGASINTMKASVRFHHFKNNHPTPTDDNRIPIATRICNKLWKQRRTRSKREPFPLVALKVYAENKSKHESEFIHARNIAMISNCFRGMMRAGEVVKTVRKSFSFEKGDKFRYIKWDLGVTKTDLEGTDSDIPLDEGGADSKICPYKSMENYIKLYREKFGEPGPNDRIFVKENRSHLKTCDVTKIIKAMVWNAGLSVQCSAHSLRAGGATEAAKAGVSIEVIMAIGRWKTNCVLRYIRAVCGAAQKLSTTMGM